jgi:hypothetical protein
MRIVNRRINEREQHEWIATTFMYETIDMFKICNIQPNTGFKWWLVAKRDPLILYRVKVMLKALVTNNTKCGFICGCNEAPTIEHILFVCKKLENIRKTFWNEMIVTMPLPSRTNFVNCDNTTKLNLIYNVLYLDIVPDNIAIFRKICNFAYTLIKTWYNTL